MDILSQKYEIIDIIGQRALGQIYRIRDKKIKTEYFLKKIRKASESVPGIDEEEFRNAINFLIHVKGTNIVNLIDYYNDKKDEYYYIILEKMDGDLDYLLKRKYKNGMLSSMIRKIFFQLNSALKIMIKEGKCLRNLKPSKILFSYENDQQTDFIIKLSGCGFSRDLAFKLSVCETRTFEAPEVGEGKFSLKCDLYSLGIILYMLKTGEYIFEGKNKFEIFTNKKKNKIKKDTDDAILNDLIKKLVVNDPRERIEWNDYFNHPFFKENDDEKEIKINDNNLKTLVNTNMKKK